MPSRPQKFILALLLVWLLAIPCACLVGPVHISPEIIFKLFLAKTHLAAGGKTVPQVALIVNLRLCRAFLALLCGGSLALSGTILQGCLRNPLADPFTLGISAGAAFGASLALVFPSFLPVDGLPLTSLTSFCAMAGAFLALAASLLIGSSANGGRESIILAGIAVASFLGAIVALVKTLNEDSVTSIVFWLLGSLQGRSWNSLLPVVFTLLPGLAIILSCWRKMDLFPLGDEQAASLGMNASKTRFWLLLGASAMTAGCVASCGIIGFVGLVIPHILRLSLGSGHGALLIASFFGGGLFLLGADCLGRVATGSGQELPAGVVTALAGGPFFAFLVWRQK